MSAAAYIREDIRVRTNRIAEAKASITNLTKSIDVFTREVALLEKQVAALRADLKRIEPIKDAVI